jgi:hypothetical protein
VGAIFDFSELRDEDTFVSTATQKMNVGVAPSASPLCPALFDFLKDFLLNPALSFPSGMDHLNKSKSFRIRFVLMVSLIFSIILFLRWLSSSSADNSFIIAMAVILEALIFTGLLVGLTSILALEQLRFPFSCALVVLATHGLLLALHDGFFLLLPLLGNISMIVVGIFWLCFKIWVFGKAWIQGFLCDWVSAFCILTISFVGTALFMTFFLKLFLI